MPGDSSKKAEEEIVRYKQVHIPPIKVCKKLKPMHQPLLSSIVKLNIMEPKRSVVVAIMAGKHTTMEAR